MTSRTRSISVLLTAVAMSLAISALGAQGPGRPVAVPGSYDSGYLVFASADSAFMYWLDSRLQIDAAMYTGSANRLASGTEIRRGRLGLKGTLFKDWHGELDIDFTGNAVEMKDMWIGYQGFPNTLLKVGNFKEPFSLETLTTSKYITFLERSYIDNFSPDRTIGAAYVRWGERWQFTGGVFGQAAGTVDATGATEGFGLTGRFTFAPVLSKDNLVHLGVAVSRRTPDAGAPADANQLRYRARPETFISRARFLTTGKIKNADHSELLNGELAMVHGPLSLQAEYTRAAVVRKDTLKTASFDGAYVFVSWFLTGESRQYLASEGEFDRVYPKSTGGAWEIAARASTMNLNDFTPGVRILGGKANNYTLGVNWHINANFKWMLNYVRVVNDNNAKPDIGIVPFTVGDKFDILQMRFSLAL